MLFKVIVLKLFNDHVTYRAFGCVEKKSTTDCTVTKSFPTSVGTVTQNSFDNLSFRSLLSNESNPKLATILSDRETSQGLNFAVLITFTTRSFTSLELKKLPGKIFLEVAKKDLFTIEIVLIFRRLCIVVCVVFCCESSTTY